MTEETNTSPAQESSQSPAQESSQSPGPADKLFEELEKQEQFVPIVSDRDQKLVDEIIEVILDPVDWKRIFLNNDKKDGKNFHWYQKKISVRYLQNKIENSKFFDDKICNVSHSGYPDYKKILDFDCEPVLKMVFRKLYENNKKTTIYYRNEGGFGNGPEPYYLFEMTPRY